MAVSVGEISSLLTLVGAGEEVVDEGVGLEVFDEEEDVWGADEEEVDMEGILCAFLVEELDCIAF